MNQPPTFCPECKTNAITSDTIGRLFCRECARRKRFVPNRIKRLSALASLIHLQDGKQTIVDTELVPMLQRVRWWWYRGRNDKEYVEGIHPLTRKHVRLHRFIMGAVNHQKIDHRNGNGYDNRKANLRFATCTQNQQNRRHQITSASDFKGVTQRKENGLWRARITVDGKRLPLGDFTAAIDAGKAYAEAAIKYFGEFARLS